MSEVVLAKTHPPEYSLHKYWARKPHNVLAGLVSREIAERGVKRALDPFCGSGVFLREAALKGLQAVGYDVNPIAALLSSVTCDPPAVSTFQGEIDTILAWFHRECSQLFPRDVRYCVHHVVTTCKNCGDRICKGQEKGRGSCPTCDARVSFSLRNLVSTEIRSAFTASGKSHDPALLSELAQLESVSQVERDSPYDQLFPENRRILSFSGMRTRDLFTRRNFFLLCRLADRFHAIEDSKVRQAALLLLTASSAQCSRLIASRNNLKTGGPAWSVPGFWVPAIHLETNPSVHLGARYKKFIAGLRGLQPKGVAIPVSVRNEDCSNLERQAETFDLVFFDPPYGDSVPYAEFSRMWNSFLKIEVDLESDLSVSDRHGQKASSWKSYSEGLAARMRVISSKLSKDARVISTFNNHDVRAWQALVSAMQTSGFECESVTYQIPAVVSSKAQFSRDGSYISDVYSVFSRPESREPEYRRNLEGVERAVTRAALARGGRLSKTLLYRFLFVSFLRQNIASEFLEKIDVLVKERFRQEGNNFILHSDCQLPDETHLLRSMVLDSAESYCRSGGFSWIEFYRQIVTASVELGEPDVTEVAAILNGAYSISAGRIDRA